MDNMDFFLLEHRRLIGVLIVVQNVEEAWIVSFLSRAYESRTRGHMFKAREEKFKGDLRTSFFTPLAPDNMF